MHLVLEGNEVTDAKLNTAYKNLQSNSILLNYAHWCGHCTVFKPEWDKIVIQMKKIKGAPHVVQIENSAHEKIHNKDKKLYSHITKNNGELYYPMIIVYKKVGDKVQKIHYEGERTADKVMDFVKGHLMKSTDDKTKTVTKATKVVKAPKVPVDAKPTKPTKVKPAKKTKNAPVKKQKGGDDVHQFVRDLTNKFFGI